MPAGGLLGFINVAKPSGMTAHDVVAAVRRITKVKQVGHAGTLDPLATGVLPVAVGKACRLLRFLSSTKVYLAEIQLGLKTDTDDIEGETIATTEVTALPEEILQAFASFSGVQRQIPPLYSAVHVGGKRLYQLARAGITPENIPEREVFIESLEVVALKGNILTARIKCSSGTYIRSIARDLGDKLKTGGCLRSLVREKAGPFPISQSLSLEQLQAAADSGKLEEMVINPLIVLTCHQVQLSQQQAKQLRQGQTVLITPGAGMAASSLASGSAESLVTPGSPFEKELSEASKLNTDSNKRAPSEDSDVILATCEGVLVAVCRHDVGVTDSLVRIQPEVVIADGEPSGK